MDYKELFHKAMRLVSSPAQAWEEIRLEEDRRKVFTAFVYPMIGLCALSVFVGALVKGGWSEPQSFQYAMTECCSVAVALFGGYFLAAYLINGVWVRLLGRDTDLARCQQFGGYAMAIIFLLQMVLGVLPDFSLLALLLQFYTVYVVWEGSSTLMEVADEERLRFTILSSLFLMLCPPLIQFVFNKLVVLVN